MENKQPDLSQPEIEAPQEKLLRQPTFDEKYGWVNKILLVLLIVMIINLGVYFVMQWNTASSQPQGIAPAPTAGQITSFPSSVTTPAITQTPLSQNPTGTQTMCTMDAMICPDGTSVGRSGPNCEFVCPK